MGEDMSSELHVCDSLHCTQSSMNCTLLVASLHNYNTVDFGIYFDDLLVG